MENKNNKNKKRKKKKWIKARHRIVKAILHFTLGLYTKLKYRVKVEKFKDEGKRPYLVLSNHQTAFDQFFLGMAFKKHLYYVASEDLFSNGFTSKIIKYLVAPIPIKKSTTDVSAVMTCMRVAREGGSIAIFPEGNRTFSGKTESIKDSVAQMAKALKLPIAFFHIEGGYGVHPRWSDSVRKGKIRGYVHSVLEYEEYKKMPDSELYDLICQRLYVNEASASNVFKGKNKANYLERAMYYCPHCGLSKWESQGDFIKCTKCGMTVEYKETTELCGVNSQFPYRFVNDWYEAQEKYISSLDLGSFGQSPIYSDNVSYTQVIPYKQKVKLAKSATLTMYKDKFLLSFEGKDTAIPFDNLTSMAVLGKNKINLYIGNDIFQLKGDKRFCAVKYVNIYFHYTNLKKEAKDGEFLGL